MQPYTVLPASYYLPQNRPDNTPVNTKQDGQEGYPQTIEPAACTNGMLVGYPPQHFYQPPFAQGIQGHPIVLNNTFNHYQHDVDQHSGQPLQGNSQGSEWTAAPSGGISQEIPAPLSPQAAQMYYSCQGSGSVEREGPQSKAEVEKLLEDIGDDERQDNIAMDLALCLFAQSILQDAEEKLQREMQEATDAAASLAENEANGANGV